VVLTQRRLGRPATHPDPAFDPLTGVAFLALTAALWLGVISLAGDTSAAEYGPSQTAGAA